MLKRLISILCCMSLVCLNLSAQTDNPLRNNDPGAMIKSPHNKPMGTVIDRNSVQMDYKSYNDEGVEDLSRAMEERDWGSEGTAWVRACETNTYESYQKYAVRYPYGAHAAEATKRMIDLRVNDIFSGKHNNLPGINRVYADDDSPTSSITIDNHTSYPLTVMFSGAESKVITVSPEGSETVTVKNGSYRIGASVSAAHVRPFAGDMGFRGGQYETGFYIVYR